MDGVVADFYPIIARAVSRLEKNTGEARRLIYEKARTALGNQLRAFKDPPLDQTQIARENRALEEAIRKVETEAAGHSHSLPASERQADGLLDASKRSPGAPILSRPVTSPPAAASAPRRPDFASTDRVSPKQKIFISYRRDDARYQARDIYRALTAVLPADQVFMDVDSIPPGANFVKVLEGWVDQCDVLLALIGPGWARAADAETGAPRLHDTQDFVRIEVRKALARNIPVVPVLLDDAPLPTEVDLPDDLKELLVRQAEFVTFRTFNADVERLIKRLGIAGQSG